MAYKVRQVMVDAGHYPELHEYFTMHSQLAKNLYNAALFRIRQVFTGWGKDSRTDNELEVFKEAAMTKEAYPAISFRRVLAYRFMEKMMRVTGNPDFFAGLPMQTAQEILKQALHDFQAWLSALKAYRRDPSGFLGMPKMPHYKKSKVSAYTFTNQDAVIYPIAEGGSYGMELKLPLTKERLLLGSMPGGMPALKEVHVKPYYGRFQVTLVLEEPEIPAPEDCDMPHTAAIDFGVGNIAAIVCTDGTSRLYKGGAILANNQWYAKKKAEATSRITQGHEHMRADSKLLRSLSFNRANFNRDQLHKISTDIIRFCIEHRVGTLVLGVNKNWKQNANIGRQNNQNFVSMPIALLRAMVKYKAEAAWIQTIEQEESYTSKADITAFDPMPVYGQKTDDPPVFSGKRMKRGLYRCANELVINADCNGAANIMRKAIPDVWGDRTDFSFLCFPEVVGFYQLNKPKKSIPVNG